MTLRLSRSTEDDHGPVAQQQQAKIVGLLLEHVAEPRSHKAPEPLFILIYHCLSLFITYFILFPFGPLAQ